MMLRARSHAALRLRLMTPGQKSRASIAPEPARPTFAARSDDIVSFGVARWSIEATAEATPVAIVRVLVTAPALGVTLAGLKVQVEFAGNPEQAKVAARLKPLTGVTVIVVVAVAPLAMLAVAEESVSPKLGAGAVTRTVTALEVDGALLLSPW